MEAQESGPLKSPAGGLIRTAVVTLLLALTLKIIVKRLLGFLSFRRKVNRLPGPAPSNALLGNIPISVFSLLSNGGGPKKNSADFYTSQIQSLLGHTLIYKDESLYRLWVGQEPVVCVWKPEIVELVLNDSFLLEKSYHYDFLRPWLGNGLLTSPGRIWRPRRKMLVPSFHFNILHAFVPVFDRKSQLLVRHLKRALSKSEKEATLAGATGASTNSHVIDVTPVITACTLDAICETIMGVSIGAQENPNNDYCQSVYIVGETFLERIIQPRYWLDWMFERTELGRLYKYHLNKLHSFTRRVIREKKRAMGAQVEKSAEGEVGKLTTAAKKRVSFKQNAEETSQLDRQPAQSAESIELGRNLRLLASSSVDQFNAAHEWEDVPKLPKAFLDLLLERVHEGTNESQRLSDEEIREEVDTFMFEGHDTTAMALSWTLFLLGHNKHVQERLWPEVDALFEELKLSGTPAYQLGLDHLKRLKYLDCVLKEALRLCPSVPFIGRQTTSELKLGAHSIPTGCVVFVLIYQLHRNPAVFPNPERFDPDRFLPENLIGRHPFAYVPFSAGPRNCIGQKFAMAEMKTILFHLLANFQFESMTPLDRARVQMEMVLRPKCPLNVRVKTRV